MYADFFGFRELPFNNTPDPRFFYSTPEHEEALASLIYAVGERKGFVLLTGEVGAGKTLVTRMMLRHFGTNIAFANVSHAVQNADDLMESICNEFDLSVTRDMGPAQVVRALHDYLLNQFAQNIPVVLVLDEAQSLPVEGFERLRMIGNLEADDAKLLQIAIVGQPELQRIFRLPKLRQLRQRIFRTFHLTALDRKNTEGYTRHRLAVVTDGGSSVFAPSAFDTIHRLSHGLPRLINTICDNALLSAYSADRREIDGAFVELIASQMMSPVEADGLTGTYKSFDVPTLKSAARRRPIAAAFENLDTTPTDHAHDPGSNAIRGLAERIMTMEARLRAELEPRARPDRDAEVGAEDVLAAISGEIHEFRRSVHHQMRRQEQRLEDVEQSVGASADGIQRSATVRGELDELLRRNETALRRTETETRILEQREQRLRSLAETLKSVLREMKPLLSRTTETVTACRQSDRDARATRERLAAQSRDTRRLMGELTRFAARLGSPGHPPRRDRVLKAASAAVAVPLTPTGSEARQAERDEADSRLQHVRESLCDLRSLTRTAKPIITPRAAAPRDPSTSRLAIQVDSLLDMIEERRSLSPT